MASCESLIDESWLFGLFLLCLALSTLLSSFYGIEDNIMHCVDSLPKLVRINIEPFEAKLAASID